LTRTLALAFGMLAFGCNGSDEPTATGVDAILALTPDTASGAVVYADNCAICHGDDGAGVEGLGSDIRAQTDQTLVITTVLDGTEVDGAIMTSFADILTDQQIADVSGFVTEGGLQ
jgi:mono/diheme cytochrome c family protein